MWDIIEKNLRWQGREDNTGHGRPYYKHIGVYAFRPDFLQLYTGLAPTRGERAERLEQLRILEHGYRIQVIETGSHAHGVDTPEDLERARRRAGGHN